MSAEAFGRLSPRNTSKRLNRRGPVSWSAFLESVGCPRKAWTAEFTGSRQWGRSVSSCIEDVRKFYAKHNRRPRNKDLAAVSSWLYKHTGHTLRTLCDEIGLPGKRSLESCRAEIQGFVEQEGRRPARSDLPAAAGWLSRNTNYTLRTLCDEMGLTGGHATRTLESCKQEIREFVAGTGRRPRGSDLSAVRDWLRDNTDYTLRTLCNELGLPGGIVFSDERSISRCQEAIRQYYAKHGCRPSQKTLPGVYMWLYHNTGYTLRTLCDEMGLEESRVSSQRTLEKCRAEVKGFFDRTGKRPTYGDMKTVAEWLRRTGSKCTLRTLCDSMGLPPRRNHPDGIQRGRHRGQDKRPCDNPTCPCRGECLVTSTVA